MNVYNANQACDIALRYFAKHHSEQPDDSQTEVRRFSEGRREFWEVAFYNVNGYLGAVRVNSSGKCRKS